MKILIIEDYEQIRASLAKGLAEDGYAVDTASDGQEGLWYAANNSYDVIILDLMLPVMDGWTVLQKLRSQGNKVPILVLTARGDVPDRVRGLDAGADDYLVKPFAFDELVARVRALVRRRYDNPKPVITLSDLKVDTASQRVSRNGREITLTARES